MILTTVSKISDESVSSPVRYSREFNSFNPKMTIEKVRTSTTRYIRVILLHSNFD